jgi:hypothetical protein
MDVTTKGLVLRETNYGNSSKILPVLTDSEGKITVSAKGARRKGSKIAAPSQFLVYSEMTLVKSRDRWYLNDGNTIELFTGLRSDILNCPPVRILRAAGTVSTGRAGSLFSARPEQPVYAQRRKTGHRTDKGGFRIAHYVPFRI